MTSAQIEEHARQRFNAIGDSFFSSAEVLNLIFAACLEMAREAINIEQVYTTSTVASQQEYSYPTSAIAIKRVTYAGRKLQQITFREDDALTLQNSATTATGTPQFYAIWNETIYLRPIPSAVGTLKIYTYNEPAALTAGSTLEVPTQFHMDLVNYVVWGMYAKDQNLSMAVHYRELWEEGKRQAKKWTLRRKRGDSFAMVQDEESLPTSILGSV